MYLAKIFDLKGIKKVHSNFHWHWLQTIMCISMVLGQLDWKVWSWLSLSTCHARIAYDEWNGGISNVVLIWKVDKFMWQ